MAYASVGKQMRVCGHDAVGVVVDVGEDVPFKSTSRLSICLTVSVWMWHCLAYTGLT